MTLFTNHAEAGKELADLVKTQLAFEVDLVLALPQGGVPVAFEVAKILNCLLDIFVVRYLCKLGYPELSLGAIASGGVQVLNPKLMDSVKIPQELIHQINSREKHELLRRERLYRKNRDQLEIKNRNIILIDDGLATGSKMHLAVKALRSLNAAKIIVAVPVAAAETCGDLANLVDQIICLKTSTRFQGVEIWYRNFSQASDEKVKTILETCQAIL
ncbi:MAG: phosphoribosyltransferase [Trueperaceae bacterium]|nr:phosphoribosyltransferase [Trueperaceae bacterium]